jgi:serine/threonine-protein kinase
LLHYTLIEQIGAGGMGVVFKATDTKLRREVAIKVLPDDFAKDQERLARFEREAHVLASLNHPGIASIHGLEEEDGVRFLVLELVPGETLADRLKRGPLPVDEALTTAKQIAEALEQAHEQNIVHRDLKPANIKLTPEGKVKVLDFGLAKAYESDTSSPDLEHSPTVLASPPTMQGMILGTAAYMSPEQARGRPVDKRADIFAFGSVVYEMLTGQRAFDGETVSDAIVAILDYEPNREMLPQAVSYRVRDLLGRCLQKNPRHRLRDIGDARIEIEETLSGELGPEPMVAPAAALSRRVVWMTVAVAVGLAAGLGISRFGRGTPEPRRDVQRIQFEFPHLVESTRIEWLKISPNGRYVVYEPRDESGLFLRDLSALDVRMLPGTEAGDGPFFSPDSRWVGFLGEGKLKKIAVSGGLPVELCDVGNSPGAAWGPDDNILFSPTWASGLYAVSAEGGEPRPVSTLDTAQGEAGHWWPRFLPGGRHVLFTVYTDKGSLAQAKIGLLDLDTGSHRSLGQGAAPRYVSNGHLVYHRAGVYEVSAFDLARLEIVGSPRVVLHQVPALDPAGWRENLFSFSETGALVYIDRGVGGTWLESSLYWLDRRGQLERLPFPPMVYTALSLAPNGERILVSAISHGEFVIQLLDLERGTFEELDFESNSLRPRWHPDGKRFAFTSSRNGPWGGYLRDQSTGQPESALIVSALDESPGDFTPDGKELVFARWNQETGVDLWLLDLESQDEKPVVTLRSDDEFPRVSPDGNWLAYETDRSGVEEVYVEPLRGPGRAVRVSSQGGTKAVWSPPGGEIFYAVDGRAMVAGYQTSSGAFDPEPPVPFIHEEGEAPTKSILFLEPSSDGRRLLVVLPEQEPRARITVVTNGFDELRGDSGQR